MSQSQPDPIKDDADYRRVMTSINRQNKPPMILRMMMRLLERYRATRKMGWSRAWNKYGLTTFLSVELDATEDAELIEGGKAALDALSDVPAEARSFVDALLSDPQHLMGFVFFAERTDGEAQYESVTLSLGRRTPSSARFRDRFDIVLEAPILDGRPQALSRMHVFIDPFDAARKEPLWSTTLSDALPPQAQALFSTLAERSWSWGPQPEKHWDHWTSAYLDYFGPRAIPLSHSHFYLPSGQRITVE